jgi:hypothetical protein
MGAARQLFQGSPQLLKRQVFELICSIEGDEIGPFVVEVTARQLEVETYID